MGPAHANQAALLADAAAPGQVHRVSNRPCPNTRPDVLNNNFNLMMALLEQDMRAIYDRLLRELNFTRAAKDGIANIYNIREPPDNADFRIRGYCWTLHTDFTNYKRGLKNALDTIFNQLGLGGNHFEESGSDPDPDEDPDPDPDNDEDDGGRRRTTFDINKYAVMPAAA